MKNLTLFGWMAGLALVAGAARGQAVSNPHSNFGGHDYAYFSIKISPEEAARFSIVENPTGLHHPDFVAAQPADAPFMLVNASITDAACLPLGWLVKDGTEQQPPNAQGGAGNFYLKPNGAFLATVSDVLVVETGAIAAQVAVQTGIQSGPLLLENGTVSAALNSASPNRHIRCGVGTSTSGSDRYVHFVVANEPVTFFELASFFRDKLRCDTALCLESQGCELHFPGRDPGPAAPDLVVCRYLKYAME